MNERKAGHDREHGPRRVPSPDEEREIASLLAEAGPRPDVPAEHLAVIRASAHEAWRKKVDQAAPANLRPFPQPASRRSSWPLVAALAASLLLAVGLTWWLGRAPSDPVTPPASPVVVARVQALAGAVRQGGRGLAEGDEIVAGVELESDPTGRAALRLASGVELRLDHGTRLRLRSAAEIELLAGAIYADTDATRGSSIAVRTALGTARDVGTRFTVALIDADTLRIRVRDGAVAVEQDGHSFSAPAGEELSVHPDGRAEHRPVDAFGPEWAWVLDAAPRFATEGQSLRALLAWAGHETGWTIRFESPELAAAKEGVVFQGRAELKPDRSLLAFLPSFELEGELEDGTLTLRER